MRKRGLSSPIGGSTYWYKFWGGGFLTKSVKFNMLSHIVSHKYTHIGTQMYTFIEK